MQRLEIKQWVGGGKVHKRLSGGEVSDFRSKKAGFARKAKASIVDTPYVGGKKGPHVAKTRKL